MDTFGQQLRQARKDAGFSTITSFADRMSEVGFEYSSEQAFSHWELDRRTPNRRALLTLLQVLFVEGGIADLTHINHILALADERDITANELQRFFPDMVASALTNNLPAQPYDVWIGRESILVELASELVCQWFFRTLCRSGMVEDAQAE